MSLSCSKLPAFALFLLLAPLLSSPTLGQPESLQAAIDQSYDSAPRSSPSTKSGYTGSIQPRVVRLSGVYNITEPVRVPTACRIECDGAMIIASSLADDEFVFDGKGWRFSLTGSLSIVDAPNGIRLNTGSMSKNLDMGSTVIRGVHFAGVRGTALDIACRSSVVVVDQCVFDRVGKIAVNRRCDQLTLRDCTARTTGVATPITTGHGRLIVDGGIYTPGSWVRKTLSAAWIELTEAEAGSSVRERMVLVTGARFGGESGGAAVVVNRASGLTRYPSAPGVCITLRDLNASNTPAPGEKSGPLVLLEKLPNRLEISGCYGMVRPDRLVGLLPGVDGEAITAGYSSTGVNNRCSILLQPHNTLPNGARTPPALRRFVVGVMADQPAADDAD